MRNQGKRLHFYATALAGVVAFIVFAPVYAQTPISPVVPPIQWEQLHEFYEELPHRYQLSVAAEGILPLSYDWSTDCGYFVGVTSGSSLEWRYDVAGECENAVVTVVATDATGAKTIRRQQVFALGDEVVEYAEISAPTQSPIPAERRVVEEQTAMQEEPPVSEKQEQQDTSDAVRVLAEEETAGAEKFPIEMVAIVIALAAVLATGGVYGLKKATEPHPEKKRGKNDDDCEKEVINLLDAVYLADHSQRTYLRDKEKELVSFKKRLDALDTKTLMNRWQNTLGGFWEAFSVMRELKSFGNKPVPELPEMWGVLNNAMTAVLGEHVGTGAATVISGVAEEYAQVTIPLETVKAVGGMYDLFKKALDADTLAGQSAINAGAGWDEKKIDEILTGLGTSIQTMDSVVKTFNSAVEPFPKAYFQAKQLLGEYQKCVGDLERTQANDSPKGDCHVRKEALEKEYIRMRKLMEENYSSCDSRQLATTMDKLEKFKKEIEGVLYTMRRDQGYLHKYRKALRKVFG